MGQEMKAKEDATGTDRAIGIKARAQAQVARSMKNAKLAAKAASDLKAAAVAKKPAAAMETAATAGTNVLTVNLSPGEDQDRAMTRTRLHPVVTAGQTIRCFDKALKDTSFQSLSDELTKHVIDVKAGKMSRPEAMLICQAHTLDVIFNQLASRAAMCLEANSVDRAEIYLRLGLKCQAQSRTTIETLSELKYPKSATFIRQQNNAQQQQVNNGSEVHNGGTTSARAREIETPICANEQLSEVGNATVDTRGTSAASDADQHVETMGAIKRPADDGRKEA